MLKRLASRGVCLEETKAICEFCQPRLEHEVFDAWQRNLTSIGNVADALGKLMKIVRPLERKLGVNFSVAISWPADRRPPFTPDMFVSEDQVPLGAVPTQWTGPLPTAHAWLEGLPKLIAPGPGRHRIRHVSEASFISCFGEMSNPPNDRDLTELFRLTF